MGKHGLQETEDVKKVECLHLKPALIRRQTQFEEKEGCEAGFTMLSCRGEAFPCYQVSMGTCELNDYLIAFHFKYKKYLTQSSRSNSVSFTDKPNNMDFPVSG